MLFECSYGNSWVQRVIIYLFIATGLLAGSNAASKDLTYGIRIGGSLTTMSGTPIPSFSDPSFNGGNTLSSKIGYIAGVFLIIPVANTISLQSELDLVYHRVDVSSFRTDPSLYPANLTEKLKLLYVELPLLAKLRLPIFTSVRPSLFAGPAVSLKILAKDEQVNTAVIDFFGVVNEPNITNVSRTGLSLILGGDIQIQIGTREVFLDLRYSHSFNDTFADVNPNDIPRFQFPELAMEIPIVSVAGEAPDLRNRAVTFSFGLTF